MASAQQSTQSLPVQQAAAAGFLTDVSEHHVGSAGAVLLRGRYHVDCYDAALFATCGVPRPISLAKAVPKRCAEFLAGRLIAGAGLAAIEHPVADIPIGADRAPVWPKSSAGSISHARGRCACLAAPDPMALPGIDVEAIATGRSLEAILKQCCSAQERDLITGQTMMPVGDLATLLFSAKETLYKMLYPIVQRYFGFQEVEMRRLPVGNGLRLWLVNGLDPCLPAGRAFDLSFDRRQDHVLTWGLQHRSDLPCPPRDLNGAS